MPPGPPEWYNFHFQCWGAKMVEVLLLLAGAILGVLFDRVATSVGRRASERRKSNLASRDREGSKSLPQAVLNYHLRTGRLDQLYAPVFLGPNRIPILFDPQLSPTGQIPTGSDQFVTIDSPSLTTFPFDRGVIERRRKSGVQLWNGQVLYLLPSTPTSAGPPVLKAGIANYYAHVTTAESIQRELSGKSPVRLLRAYQGVADVLRADIKPVALSCAASCIFESSDGPVVAIHRRSASVVNAPDTVGVCPLYGMESNIAGELTSRYGPHFYNFAKEFLEEFLGHEKVVHAAESRTPHPDWVFDEPFAVDLLAEFESGRATLYCLGLGVEMTQGSIVFALLAHFRSTEFFGRVAKNAKLGWELKEIEPGGKPLAFLPLDAIRIRAFMEDESMSPASTFALDLALQVVTLNGFSGPGNC